MTELLYIIKIVVYFAFIFSIYFVARKSKNRKIPLWVIIVFAILFGLYAIWCAKYPYYSDRLNYAFRFEDLNGTHDYFVRNESKGLYVLEQILHLFTYDARVLFFTVAFFFMAIVLLAYRNSKNSTPFSILFLMLTIFPVLGLYAVKQAMAMALLSLGYALYTKENRSKKTFFGSAICLILAILFHESAWIIVPIILIIKLIKNKYIRGLIFATTVVGTVFFRQISAIMIKIASTLIPSLGDQLAIYASSDGGIARMGSGMITAFKGVPFYYVLIAGFRNRKKIMPTFKGYDSYLFLTLFVSVTIILSGYMYWMFRFGLLLYMPVCDFAFIIYKNIDNKKNKAAFLFFVLGISLFLSIRLMSQYYFLYGGL